jgi:tetratricopeptide (TPR) repeat protein
VERWEKSKGHPIEATCRHAMLHFVEHLPYESFLAILADGLQREPEHPLLLVMAYRAAFEVDDRGRRLHFSERLAAISAEAVHHFAYGIECIRNLMLDRAEAAFSHALELEPGNLRALLGLGKCRLDRFDLPGAENWYRQALKIQESKLATEALAIIGRLRHGKAWTSEEKRLKQFWVDWHDKELAAINVEEQQRLIGEALTVNAGERPSRRKAKPKPQPRRLRSPQPAGH